MKQEQFHDWLQVSQTANPHQSLSGRPCPSTPHQERLPPIRCRTSRSKGLEYPACLSARHASLTTSIPHLEPLVRVMVDRGQPVARTPPLIVCHLCCSDPRLCRPSFEFVMCYRLLCRPCYRCYFHSFQCPGWTWPDR
jgi:hypothetical protein